MDRCTCSEAGSAAPTSSVTTAQPDSSPLLTIDLEPYIGETPPRVFESWLTPNPLFYVRNHFSQPQVDVGSWSLSVDGCVSGPVRLTASQIEGMPKHTVPVTLECAGNNRTDLEPAVPGNQFNCGAISTAVWGGVSLKSVLEMAGVQPEAVEIVFEGADSGVPAPGYEHMPYLRSLPVEVAMHPDTILAYAMNGEALTVEHGQPLRLIVPGWYGMASVKWLHSIRAIDHSFEGFFQTDRYIINDSKGKPDPVTRMLVKSHINRPEHGETIPMREFSVIGAAWSGNGRISNVEVSDDGGATWGAARLDGPDQRYAWRQWCFSWKPQAPGHHTVMARAQDELGNWQPMEPDWNALGYAINGVMAVCVSVSA